MDIDDDADLDLVMQLTRLALNRLDALPADERAVIEAHGRPVVAMLDEVEPLDLIALREHLRALAPEPELVADILGADDASALGAVQRARAIRIGRAWGRDPRDP
jgi:hypothetical protein